VWPLRVTSHQLQAKIGDSIRIAYPRWRFVTGRSGIVLGVTERSKSNATELIWWG